ncbi:hypothetical protein VPH35_092752 [Triticum aestivum]
MRGIHSSTPVDPCAPPTHLRRSRDRLCPPAARRPPPTPVSLPAAPARCPAASHARLRASASSTAPFPYCAQQYSLPASPLRPPPSRRVAAAPPPVSLTRAGTTQGLLAAAYYSALGRATEDQPRLSK